MNADPTEVPLRVLIVDDSALFRQSVTAVLRGMAGVEVVGIARDGIEAIEKIQQFQPDVLTLDVEMPNRNGIETLREIQRLRLKSRAIMLSSLTEVGAQVTLDALFEGAFDFITKPTGGVYQARDELTVSLGEKLTAFRAHLRSHRGGQPRAGEKRDGTRVAAATPSVIARPQSSTATCDVVAIGLSTGGPQTLRHVLPRLPADFPVPIVIVQHMPAKYTASMAQRLDEVCPMRIVEASHGQHPIAGCVHIAPGGNHLKVVRQHGHVTFQVTQDPPENSCRPAVDYTFRGLADVYGGRILAIIMTGMGRDGLAGCRRIHELGGVIYAQDEATSAVFGMPKAISDAGLADRILPLGKIAPAILRHVTRTRTAPLS